MRLGVRLGLIAQWLRLGDKAVILAWLLGKAVERRTDRWRHRNTVALALRDAPSVFWTVAPPEKLLP